MHKFYDMIFIRGMSLKTCMQTYCHYILHTCFWAHATYKHHIVLCYIYIYIHTIILKYRHTNNLAKHTLNFSTELFSFIIIDYIQ